MQINAFSPTFPVNASERDTAAHLPSRTGNQDASAAAKAFGDIATDRADASGAAVSRQTSLASILQETPKKWAAAVMEYLERVGVRDEATRNYQAAHPGLDHDQAATKFEQDIENIMPVATCPADGPARMKDRLDQRHELHSLLMKYGVIEAAGKKLAPQMAQRLKDRGIYDYILDEYQAWHPGLTRQQAASQYLEGEGRHTFWSRFLRKVDTPKRQTVQLICNVAANAGGHPRQAGTPSGPAAAAA